MLNTSNGTHSLRESLASAGQQLQTLHTRLVEVADQLATITTTIDSLPTLELNGLEELRASSPSHDCTDSGTNACAGALLGEALATNFTIAVERQELLKGVYAEDPAALALAGRLMIFRAARGEQRLPLLREIGEAFYQWSATVRIEPCNWREALISWLLSECAATGLKHQIELVNVADRFDRDWHQATTSGTEIASVGGWVVLRENGSVYTKAIVTIR